MTMYNLKVIKSFSHPDGRIFEVEHDCHALDVFEVAELVTNYPDHFEALDEITADTIKDDEKMAHYSGALKTKGALKASKK